MSKIVERYSGIAIALHWLVGALMIVNVGLGLSTEAFGKANTRFMIGTHESVGVTILGLMIMRVLWRASHRSPEFPESYKPWDRRLSLAVHVLLYLVALGMPVSGLIHDSAWNLAPTIKWQWFGLFEWPRIGWIMGLEPGLKQFLHVGFGKLHELLAWVLYLLFALHVGGALKHQLIDREKELQRMWPAR